MEDSASSPENAFAAAQAVLFPADVEKEKGFSYDKLLKTGLQSNIKAMQKMFVGLDRARDHEKEMKKEAAMLLKRAEKAEKDSAYHAQLWREANKDNDELKEELEAFKKKTEENELALRQELEQARKFAAESYDRGVLETTADYVGQMPAVKAAIWDACWETCLTVLEVPKDSPHWANRHFPGQPSSATHQPQGALSPPADSVPPPPDAILSADQSISADADLAPKEGEVGLEPVIESPADHQDSPSSTEEAP